MPGQSFVYWYGVLLTVMTYVELRALIGLGNDALVVIMVGSWCACAGLPDCDSMLPKG